jgi:thiol-disulfide isomerase/thioredoxin
MKILTALLLGGLSLSAQERYVMWGKNTDFCPRVDQRGASPFQNRGEVTWTTGTKFIPSEKRMDVSKFTLTDEAGKSYTLKEQAGKPVIVGLWSTHCEPSLFLLGEMAQLYGRTAKFGFEVFPVNYDREGWRTIIPFLRQQRMQAALAGVKVFLPELGLNGVNVFMQVVPALPTFFIVDRQGRLAVQSYGFKAGELSKWLKVVISEPASQDPAHPQTIQPPPEASPQPVEGSTGKGRG